MTTWVGRARAAAGRVPRPVVAVTVLFGLVLSIWSVAVPHYRAPDEPAHVDLILYLAEGNPYPDFDGRFFGKAVGLAEDRYLIDAGEPWPRFAADDVAPRGSRPDVTDLGGTAPDPVRGPSMAAPVGPVRPTSTTRCPSTRRSTTSSWPPGSAWSEPWSRGTVRRRWTGRSVCSGW